MLKKILFSIFLMAQMSYSGVVVLCDLPAHWTSILAQYTVAVEKRLAELNQGLNPEDCLYFEKAPFAGHLTAAFITPDKKSALEILNQLPGLSESLQELASQNSPIDLESNLNAATVDLFTGKAKFKLGGSDKTNYDIVVLKPTNNSELIRLAADVKTLLDEKYQISQRFPFQAHITLGRIYKQNNTALPEDLKSKLMISVITNQDNQDDLDSKITEIVLSGDDGSKIKYPFKKIN